MISFYEIDDNYIDYLRQFDIKIEALKANKGVYYLKTNKGEKCLKKINYGPQKLLFVYGAKEHRFAL